MSSKDAIGPIARRRDGTALHVEVEAALADVLPKDASTAFARRRDSEVLSVNGDVACAPMSSKDAIGPIARRREVAARQFHPERARLPVVADGDASPIRGHVGGGDDRDVTLVAIAHFGGRYPDGAIETAFRVPGQAVEIIAGSLTIVVEDEVIGEPDREVAVRLIGAVEDVAV